MKVGERDGNNLPLVYISYGPVELVWPMSISACLAHVHSRAWDLGEVLMLSTIGSQFAFLPPFPCLFFIFFHIKLQTTKIKLNQTNRVEVLVFVLALVFIFERSLVLVPGFHFLSQPNRETMKNEVTYNGSTEQISCNKQPTLFRKKRSSFRDVLGS